MGFVHFEDLPNEIREMIYDNLSPETLLNLHLTGSGSNVEHRLDNWVKIKRYTDANLSGLERGGDKPTQNQKLNFDLLGSIHYGFYPEFKYLIGQGASVNISDYHRNWNPLHVVLVRDNFAIGKDFINLMIEEGSAVQDPSGFMFKGIKRMVERKRNLETIDYLIEKGKTGELKIDPAYLQNIIDLRRRY